MTTAAADERIGFEDAYAVHRVRLLRLALLLPGSRNQAEDVVQAAFTTAYPRWGAIDEPRAYLRRAVVNASNDVHRRRAKDRRLPREPEPLTSIPEVDETWAVLVRLPSSSARSSSCTSTRTSPWPTSAGCSAGPLPPSGPTSAAPSPPSGGSCHDDRRADRRSRARPPPPPHAARGRGDGRGRSGRRRVLVAAGCGLAGVPLAAFMDGRLTSEYVQELPPPGVIQSGEIDGVRYWLVESFHEDVCGQQMPGWRSSPRPATWSAASGTPAASPTATPTTPDPGARRSIRPPGSPTRRAPRSPG